MTRENAEAARGKAKVIAVNNAYEYAPWADMLYACDYRWWKEYRPEFKGLKVCPHEGACKEFRLIYVKGAAKPGLSLTQDRIHYGGNSGFQALNIAILSGAKKIILLGFDMQPDPQTGRLHFHSDHGRIGNPQKNTFMRWLRAFNEAAPQIERLGIQVLNCSNKSALNCFQVASLEGCL
jgi:hypothetical protein